MNAASYYCSTKEKTSSHITLYQLFICLSALVVSCQTQGSQGLPTPVPQHIGTTIVVLTITGFLVLCGVVGVVVYCICQPWKSRTTVSETRLGL